VPDIPLTGSLRTKVREGIQNIEELELLNFMKEDVVEGRGIVVDARLKSWFEFETIPSAINIPFTLIERATKSRVERLFSILGMKIKSDGSWDFSGAKRLGGVLQWVSWVVNQSKIIY